MKHVVYTGPATTRRLSTEDLGHDCDEDGNFAELVWKKGESVEMHDADFEQLQFLAPYQFREVEAAISNAPASSRRAKPQGAGKKAKKAEKSSSDESVDDSKPDA